METAYQHLNIQQRIRRKAADIFGKTPLFSYGPWIEYQSQAEMIILEDCTVDDQFITVLRRKFPDACIVYWFRNSLDACDYGKSRMKHLDHASRCDQVISFDKKDCRKYGFSYIENCYCVDQEIKREPVGIVYDLVFPGAMKKRYTSLMRLINYTECVGFHNYIYFYHHKACKKKYVHTVSMPYQEYLKLAVRGRAVLDYTDHYQHGYSLRVFEALFYQKKLVTNLAMIRKEPFYHPANIYIYDENNENSFHGLKEFLDLPYVMTDQNAAAPYEIRNWVERVKSMTC